MASREMPELRDVVGIGQEAHVEHQVAVAGNTVAIAEAGASDQERTGALAPLETLHDESAQFVNVELGSIKCYISFRADRRQRFALRADGVPHGLIRRHRVGTAR